ncbi:MULTISPECIES: ATP-binding protein [Streptomyces]|uniref:ATP-binding protein n=1 Tax=Streptomyces TaxID=1883 RepID=UPI0035B38363
MRRTSPRPVRPARSRLRPRRPVQSLRTRLVLTFLAVSALSALLTSALTFRQARAAILDRAQDAAVSDLRVQTDSLAPGLPATPSRSDLTALVKQLDLVGESRQWRTSAEYGDLRAGAGGIPRELRTAARDGGTVRQRVERHGEPWLLIAMPVERTRGSGASGLTVYAALSLHDEKTDIAALVTAAQAGAVPALLFALVPALLAARSLLRPVRRLRSAAEEITGGRLDTRLPVTGRDELADLTRTFNEMAATLERDDAELRRMGENARRFAADVSHELRTPLAAMAAVTEVLDEGAADLDPDTADAVRLVSDETRKLTRLVDDLMEISRFDAGAAALHLDEVDLATSIRKTLQLRGWSGQVNAELPEGVRARLDPRRLDVVLANLVGNALRHGGPPVTVRAHQAGPRVVVEVRDRGPGIPEEVLPHVFDRFYKADSARTRSHGSGLGLSVARENVRLHGGTLTAANPPGGGALFTVTLPSAAPQDRAGEAS